jgi:alkylation response protein AidB-like acyl-CoA dehydrogenase
VDFGFSEVQEDLRGLAAEILADHVTRDRLKELEAGADRVDRRVWEAFAAANLLGVALPESVGGSGYGIMELCVLLQEVGRRVAPVPLLETVAMAALPIARFGSDEQQKRLLSPVVAGTSFLTTALAEPAAHDPAVLRTAAVPDGDGWVLTGEKVAVPWGPVANRVLVSARTGEAAAGVFVVDPSAAGVSLGHAESTNRQPRSSIRLDGVRVLAEDVLGDPTAGFEMLEWIRLHTLAGLCATAAGVLDEAVRVTAAYLSEREQFGRPLATFQGAALRAADAYIDSQATGIATWSAIWRLATGLPADDALAVAKFWVADGGQRVVAACQHLHGGMGVDIDYPIHRYFLWAKQLELDLGGAHAQLLRLGASIAAA